MYPDTSRRSFLRAAALLTAASTLPSRALAVRTGGEVFTNASVGVYGQGLLTHEHLKTLIGSLFLAFTADRGTAYLHLRSVEKVQTKAKQAGWESLFLSFDTGGTALEQDSYLLDHGTLGRFALFLVPGGKPDARTAGAIILRHAAS